MTAAFRTLVRCLVCGFTEVRTDEVIDRGIVLLHECPRCEHRWTQRGPASRVSHERLTRVVRAPSQRTAA
jgi:Zn-finger nucleic acid-binding protein